MPVFSLPVLMQWLQLLPQVILAGSRAVEAVKQALVDNGVAADDIKLDEVIADAARRQAQAEAEANATS